MFQQKRLVLTAILFVAAASQLAAQSQSTSFRVDTDVYDAEKKEPVKQTLTLFDQGVYYDFAIDSSQDVTIVDPRHGKIVLLSPKRGVKTLFPTDELLAYVSEARQKITNSDLTKVIAHENQVVFDAADSKLRVGDSTLMYEATMQPPKDASIAAQYRDFADWSARLNAVLPPRYPPFLRLELNKQIAERIMLPSRIDRVSKHNNHTLAYRSQLIVNGRLSTEDQQKIVSVGQLLQSCKEVTQTEFLGDHPALISKTRSVSSR